MMSTDSGVTWVQTSFPPNYYVTSIAAIDRNTLVVAARSHFFDRNAGGVWVSSDKGFKTWTKTLDEPVFNLLRTAGALLAAVAYNSTDAVMASSNGGRTWTSWSDGIEWDAGHAPFYPTMARAPSGTLFMGALTVNVHDSTKTASKVFWRSKDSKVRCVRPVCCVLRACAPVRLCTCVPVRLCTCVPVRLSSATGRKKEGDVPFAPRTARFFCNVRARQLQLTISPLLLFS